MEQPPTFRFEQFNPDDPDLWEVTKRNSAALMGIVYHDGAGQGWSACGFNGCMSGFF